MTQRNSFVAALSLLAVLAFAAPTTAETLSVCPSGCSFNSLQSAVANASKGDVIALGAGTFIGPVRIDKSLTIKGQGASSTIVGGGLIVGGVNLDVRIESVTLTRGLNGLAVLGISNVVVQDVTIAENIADGVLVTDRSLATLYNVDVVRNGSVLAGNPVGAGLSANGAGRIVTSDVTIAENVSAGVAAFGQSNVQLGTLTQVLRNGTAQGIVPGFGGEGIVFGGTSTGTVDAVLVQANGAAGIAVRESANVTIRNTQVLQNAGVGIQIGGPVSSNPDVELTATAKVENTKVAQNGSHGILLGDLAKVLESAIATLLGNGITDNGACGIALESHAADATMENNFLSGNPGGSVCQL